MHETNHLHDAPTLDAGSSDRNEIASPLKAKLASHWNQRSVTFDREQGVRTPRQKEAWLAFHRRQLGERTCQVLDVGTGTGFLVLLLAELGHRCRGLDLSPEMLNTARRNAEQEGLDIHFERGDAENLADADGTYDVVISRNVLWTSGLRRADARPPRAPPPQGHRHGLRCPSRS